MEIQLNELFDQGTTNVYPYKNLNPKAAVPQTFAIDAPGSPSLLVRLVSGGSEGDKLKAVKPSDKTIHAFLFSLSDKGNVAELKHGLGDDPVGALNTIYSIIMDIVKEFHMEAVLFRFPVHKMAGKATMVQRIIARLVKSRSGGRFTVMEEMSTHGKKYAYVLIHKRTADLENTDGIAKIDEEQFKKIETKVGDTYVDSKTGEKVSKADAIATAIVKASEKTSDKQVIAKTRISRRAALEAQNKFLNGVRIDSYSEEHLKAFNKLSNSTPIYSTTDEDKESTVVLGANHSAKTAGLLYNKEISAFVDSGDEDSNKFPIGRKLYISLYSPIRAICNGVPGVKLDSKSTTLELMENLAPLFNNFSIENMDATIIALTKEVNKFSDKYNAESNDKLSLLNTLIAALFNSDSRLVRPVYESFLNVDEEVKGLTGTERDAIRSYCGAGFKRMNRFLLGTGYEEMDTAVKQIKALDKAFKKGGIRLSKGTTLYRGQRVPIGEAERLLDQRVFVFANYVSTSVAPIIFNNSNINGSFDVNATNTDTHSNDEVISSTLSKDVLAQKEKGMMYRNGNISYGFVIKGADKIKVLVPAGYSSYPEEAEVILPRGVALKINKVTGQAGAAAYRSGGLLINAEIIDQTLLDESTELFDGDALFNEGVVKPLNPLSFKQLLESVPQRETDYALETLASIVNVDALPDKFAE